jgi:hypothetical protein
LLRVKTFVLRLALFFAAAAGALTANVRTSLAYQSGESRWCVVVNKGGDVMAWDCEYDSRSAPRPSPAAAASARSIHIGAGIHHPTDTEPLPSL